MDTLIDERIGKDFYLAQIRNTDLSNFSYYLESNKEALIIDPGYNTKIYRQILEKRQAVLKKTLMTHYHADFISGHLELKVPLFMGPGSKNKMNHYQINELKNCQQIALGSIFLHVLHTPGHSLDSSTFILVNSDGRKICMFTGDLLFLGDVGRPDLSVQEHVTKVDLAGMLYDSLQTIKKLPDQIIILPAHGFGSACAGKKIEKGNFSTLGEQKQKNYAMKIEGKNQFVTTIVSDITPPPPYYFYDAKLNKIGPPQHQQEFKKANYPIGAEQFEKLAKKCKIFDTRTSPNKAGFIKMSYQVNGKGPITSWVPMVANPHDQILIVTDEGKGEQTLKRFIRIGYFNVKGFNNFKMEQYSGERVNLQVMTGGQVLDLKQRNHLDVRNQDQWRKTGIIQGAVTISLKQIKNRSFQLGGMKNLVVNCSTAMRARFAMSILAASGIQSCVLNEKIEDFEKIGFKLVPYIPKYSQND